MKIHIRARLVGFILLITCMRSVFADIHGSNASGKLQDGSMMKKNKVRKLEEKEVNCKGDTLKPGERLRPKEYIGPDWSCTDGGYRVGLDEDGWLGAWFFDTLLWFPGVQGDYLSMQEGDGNLVLYKNNPSGKDEAVWDTNCFGEGVKFVNSGGLNILELVDKDGETVWNIFNNGQESICYPGDTPAPQVRCRGSILGSGVRLYPNEYMCDSISDQHRFGLNDQGRLALWHGGRVIWSPPQQESRGDFIEMQDDGHLVMYKEGEDNGENKVVWKTGCFSSGAILRIDNGGVSVTKRNQNQDVLWFIDNSGDESKCNPTAETPSEDCSRVSLSGDTCEVKMIDHLNMNYVKLRVKALGRRKFLVTDRFESSCEEEPWNVSVKVRKTGKLAIDAVVPDVTCEKLLTKYTMKDDSQLKFIYDPSFPCTNFGKDLIYFLIEEWFYFG